MSTMISVYRFAKMCGKNPQQFYGMIQNGSFPQELYRYEQVGDRQQPLVKLEEAQEWFAARSTHRLGREAAVAQVIEAIEDKRLAERVRKYFAEHPEQ